MDNKKLLIHHHKAVFNPNPTNFNIEYSCGIFLVFFHQHKNFIGYITGNEPHQIIDSIKNVLKKFKEHGSTSKDISAKALCFTEEEIIETKQFLEKLNIDFKYKKVSNENIPIHIQLKQKQIFCKSKNNKIQSEPLTPINILIVDDSATMRKILGEMFTQNDKIGKIFKAEDAFKAQDIISKEQVDVITLDINMPGMDGVTFLKKYMKITPIPTIMITSFNINDSSHIMDALDNGAFDYIEKPSIKEIRSHKQELLSKVYSAYKSRKKIGKSSLITTERIQITNNIYNINQHLFAIGASTGGTNALKTMLVNFPTKIPPTLIVQHIPPVFSKAFADRMNDLCPFTVKEASHGDPVIPNQVLIAPGGQHMKLCIQKENLIVQITDDPPVNRFKPSVDYLFNSISECQTKKKIIAALLTGMGNDGAKGLLALKNNGAHTIAQDEESSVVFGMPKAAIDLNAHCEIVNLSKISNVFIDKIINGTRLKKKAC